MGDVTKVATHEVVRALKVVPGGISISRRGIWVERLTAPDPIDL